MTGCLDVLDANAPLIVLALFAVGIPIWLGFMRYHWFAFNEPYERASRGYFPIAADETVLTSKRTMHVRENGTNRLYATRPKRVVLTDLKVCVSFGYAAWGYWLYTIPVEKVWQAFICHSPTAIVGPFRLRLDFEGTTNLQTLEIGFDTPNEILTWKAHLESLDIKIRGDIPWPR